MQILEVRFIEEKVIHVRVPDWSVFQIKAEAYLTQLPLKTKMNPFDIFTANVCQHQNNKLLHKVYIIFIVFFNF